MSSNSGNYLLDTLALATTLFTFIGGKARNMHKDRRAVKIHGTGGDDKIAVMGFLERGGEVRTNVIDTRKKTELQSQVKANVSAGAALYTDALASYDGLHGEFFHQVVDHAVTTFVVTSTQTALRISGAS
jgi:hypothetical protein